MSKLAYSIAETAAALGIGTSKVRDEIRKSKIAVKYIDSKPVVLAAELTAYLESLPSEAPAK